MKYTDIIQKLAKQIDEIGNIEGKCITIIEEQGKINIKFWSKVIVNNDELVLLSSRTK